MQFALIHGGWQSGWCWDGVRDALSAQGHDVIVPIWLGLPGDTAFDETTAIVDHAGASVAEQIHSAGFTDVVLVGHSGGGPVMQRAAEELGAGVRRLVFVDAWGTARRRSDRRHRSPRGTVQSGRRLPARPQRRGATGVVE